MKMEMAKEGEKGSQRLVVHFSTYLPTYLPAYLPVCLPTRRPRGEKPLDRHLF